MLPLLLFLLPAGQLCVSSGFILLGMQSCPGIFPQLCALTLTSVKVVTSLQEWMPVANFLMLIYLDFLMILWVIQIADELTGGAQRQAVPPNDWRFVEWERSALRVFSDCLLVLPQACSHLPQKRLSVQAPSTLLPWHLLVSDVY